MSRTVVKTIFVPEIGEVPFRRSRRARHISIRIDLTRGVSVTVPPGASLEQARRFMISKIPWAKRHLARIMELRTNIKDYDLPPVDKSRARTILIARLAWLASMHGFRYNRVFIKNQRTLWGSCSTMNNINLNANLVRLPRQLQDYVLLHELVHTRIKNHGPQFWQTLDEIMPDARTLRKRLQEYKPGLS